MKSKRASGILLHITSLPSKYGIGDLGPQAYKFVELLIRAGQSYWQVLPLNQITSRPGHSPYSCLSAFAGNTLVISPDLLYRQGLLTRADIRDRPAFSDSRVDYSAVSSYKKKLLIAAFKRFKSISKERDYQLFCSKNKNWLEDYAVFAALRRHFWPRLWCNWPVEFRDRRKQSLKFIKPDLRDIINQEKFSQYMFFKQWACLKRYCNQKGIRIIGDIPIYVAYDSADVWCHPEFFKLTRTKRPRAVAGVPPDSFSRTGQLWGNPVYDWRALKDTDYRWWIHRIKHNLSLFDVARIDHFRGFIAYWQVPSGRKTAKTGRWMKGPKEDFFNKLLNHLPLKRLIVENLGYITPDVKALIKKFGLTGMKVLLSTFNEDEIESPHRIDNHIKNSVVYTSTHDNNTARGWFEGEAKPGAKKRLYDSLGHKVTADQVHWELIRLAMSSASNIVIVPMQDVLGLDAQGRMNHPGTVGGNWSWRLGSGQIKPSSIRKLAGLTQTYGRS